MGMDIHMHLVQNGQYIKKNIFDRRDREWFSNLSGEGDDFEYNELSFYYGISPQSPKEINPEELIKKGYFNLFYINVKDFKEWFEKYRPDIDAGWVTTYDKWRIENKNYVPEYINHYLDKEDNINNMHFITITNPYDSSAWLYQYLIENEIPDEADITYWFDN